MKENNELCQKNSTTLKPNETPPIEQSLTSTTPNIKNLSKSEEKIGKRICKKCLIEQPLSNFIKIFDKRRPDNIRTSHRWSCRKCIGKDRKPYLREFRQNNFVSLLLYQAEKRAAEMNLPFDLTEKDLIIPNECPVLKIPVFHKASHGKCENTPSLDRIDNTKGYTKDNTIVISWRANNLKGDSTYQEIEDVYNFYKSISNYSPEANSFYPYCYKHTDMYNWAKSRAKIKKLNFSLDKSDIKIPYLCPIFKFPIKFHNKRQFDSPSLDRIIPSNGYSGENVIVVSWRANHVKKASSLEEMYKIFSFYKNLLPLRT